MNIGISLASFYPQHPEDTVVYAKQLGFDTVEIFLNTYSELDDKYIDELSEKIFENNLKVYSIHPFTSALENYMFYSPYDRRIEDSLKLYELYCKAALKLGAKVINLHGDRGLGLKDIDKYISCFEPLIELGEKYRLIFSNENVFYNSVNHPEFIYKLRNKLGVGTVKFTFDIKQANKGGSNPVEVLEAMGSDIINFHINDYDSDNICLLPGEGIVDHKRIFELLNYYNYSGPALIEVYSDNYSDFSQITKSKNFLLDINKTTQI